MLNISDNKDNEMIEQKSILFKTLKTPGAGKVVAKVLVGVSLLFFILLFFPWQQNIRATGKITAFSPGERPQSIQSAIAGRIEAWHITEGQFVEKGDTILTLSEVKDDYFDPQLLDRTAQQIEAKKQGIEAKKDKVEALEQQIEALEKLQVAKFEQAKNKLQQARFKLTSDSVDFEAEKVRFANQENIFERNKKRFDAGNIALTKFQELESKFQESKMKLVSSENKFLESKTEVINAQVNISGVQAEYQDKISKARSDLNNTTAEVFEAEAALAKLENQYSNYEIRTSNYQLIAPQSGYVVKAMKAGVGETIKEGESVAQVMPENPQLAVEMYVRAMDVPLIQKGRKARIEFDGWPALQFSGWPSVSVGTFGGVVQVIDRVNSVNGEFRILVTPDPEEEPWPEQLRIGSGTKGWVMLDNVPVWYEIWRQLNGFPPSLYSAPEESVLKKEEGKK
ncbi:HlyD family efflux transporter periplasmic adaptor subunit [uncultured Roseivirga sp.]|uniref:HlyD family secretion protein n=1 Tax=uncultured Roseivirga sp. TaxID=543088 RepID=UPI000D7A81D9|nr:HlyD family efflux transporter periplasmic adaptor subunit [uncultured Roseivirga sp.]PWL27965.1 MAG: biotin attachment protein [Roseivirga sp. XM-24bin3]